MPNRNSNKGNPPYQPNPTPDPTPAPMFTPAPPQPQVFRSQHGANSIGYLLSSHYREVTISAIQQDRDIASLNARTEDLQRAVSKREQDIRDLENANREDRAELARVAEKTQETQRLATNNWDDSADTKRTLEFHGFPVPEVSLGSGVGDRKVAPADPSPTGPQETPELCPCGAAMVWDREHNQYVHPLPEGGWELAGESCKRRREQTLTMPPVVDDVVVGS